MISTQIQSINNNIDNIFKNLYKCEINGKHIEIRTLYDKDNNPYFVGKDIAKALGYECTKNSIRDHVDKEDKIMFKNFIRWDGINATLKLEPKTYLLNESGLYSLILSSKMPASKLFKRWVTSEVLPSIRKYGEYKLQRENDDLRKLIIDMKNEHKMYSLDITNKFNELIGYTKDIQYQNNVLINDNKNIKIELKETNNKLTNVEQKLDIATDDRVPKPMKKCKTERFVILRFGDINEEFFNYYSIRAQKYYVNSRIEKYKKVFPNLVTLVDINEQPNSVNIYNRMKEQLTKYMEFDGNDFNIINTNESNFIQMVMDLNDEKKIV